MPPARPESLSAACLAGAGTSYSKSCTGATRRRVAEPQIEQRLTELLTAAVLKRLQSGQTVFSRSMVRP
jgi:hypothetical protein